MYNSQEVANRIKQKLKEQNAGMKDMLSELGLGINTISELSKGKRLSYISFARIADYLDCSVDYLLGRTDIPEVNKGNTQKIIQLTEEYIANLQQEQSLESDITGAAASSTKKIHPQELAFEDLINIDTDDLD